MEIRLACVEDGIENYGFRKISSFIKTIHPQTKMAYIPTGNLRSIIKVLTEKGAGDLKDKDILSVAEFLVKGDVIGICSMTQYSKTVKRIIAKIRDLNPKSFIVWGGIHAIVHPEDAIKYADAVCTGEGEFSFKNLLELLKSRKDITTAAGFWFNKDDKVIKNKNLPLMKAEDMDNLPPLTYQDGEYIYHRDKGFKAIGSKDFMDHNGLMYGTIWSIGCPLHCTFCANTKFIEYDSAYRRLRHSSPRTVVDEIKRAIVKQPQISVVGFFDDSFLNLPYKVLEEFCKLYKAEVNIPFMVVGVVPNYVRDDGKIPLLIDAGLNRLRMGIQSGSDNMLEFYKRPTKLHQIKEATEVINKYKKYMVAPAFDIILENPLETPDDTRATLDLIYNMPRPFTLNIYALRVIPNTQMAKDLEARGVKVPPIDKNYFVDYKRTLGNSLVFALCFWKMPKWFYEFLRKKTYPVHTKQKQYPILFFLCRTGYLIKREIDHIRFMDFSYIPGNMGYYFWKLGIIKFWQKNVLKQFHLPEKEKKLESKII
jgi:anaerobic magnesium-protoporphyrin IX monomethyl ester cyclase|tara:strand:- start:1045 stop:2655 length:1611 start_codon:yes stop_codon:yes gene_type:complete